MPAVISQTAFEISVGVMLSISLLLGTARTYIRFQRFGQLFADDICLCLAMISLIVGVSLVYKTTPFIYREPHLFENPNKITKAYHDQITTDLNFLTATAVMVGMGPFLVKWTFLFFFRQLIRRNKKLETWWKCVLGALIVGSPVAVFSNFISCPATGFNEFSCQSRVRSAAAIGLNIGIDIFTDLLLISIPIALIVQVQIGLSQKLTLASLLCLSIFTILINVVGISEKFLITSIPWSLFLGLLESTVAVMAVSLSTFRILLSSDGSKFSLCRSKPKLLAVRSPPRKEGNIPFDLPMTGSPESHRLGILRQESDKTDLGQTFDSGRLDDEDFQRMGVEDRV